MRLGAEHDGIKGKIRWKVHHSPSDKIDLEAFLTHSDAGVAYARCWFRANDDKAILATGSDDGIKVWIDGKEVLAKKLRRDALPGEDRTPIKLNDADWHEMLVKVDNRTASWAFYLERAKQEKANLFFGVCPRPAKECERSFHVRTVRCFVSVSKSQHRPALRVPIPGSWTPRVRRSSSVTVRVGE